ncbi:MAG TPA: CocE/NonD family hydrolase [Candidatus Binataceae bacterium]|nr:CocE/NonD family hydrolase [Candidatus Binataceae bacterium]
MADIIIDKNVPVPMRDGVVLRADVFRQSPTARYPVLLERTPYGKTLPRMVLDTVHVLNAVEAGYAVVIQDCRGRFASDGEFVPFFCDINDGYDTVEWCAGQSWSNGRIGMFGTSYVGATQLLAAISAPPHLNAICPVVSAADFHNGWIYEGGAFRLGFVAAWVAQFLALGQLDRLPLSATQRETERQNILDSVERLRRTLSHMPLMELPLFKLEGLAPYFQDWLAHPDDGEYWRRFNIIAHHDRVTAPALHMGGWYDLFVAGALHNFTGLRKNAATERARAGQRLLFGPWVHGSLQSQVSPIGERDYGWRSLVPLSETKLGWFNHWLRDVDNWVASDAPVRVYVLNKGWRHEQEWPLAGTQWTAFYLQSAGRANSLNGDGRLSRDTASSQPPDVFLYNPFNPTPTIGVGGIYDQRSVEARSEVLVYSTPPLTEALEVTGPVIVVLYASSSAPDTDFSAKLVDVAPNGYAANLCDGLLRARYRNSPSHPELMQPGEVYEFKIDLNGTGNVFLPGHQIRLEISSSNFPKFDRNPNIGEPVALARHTQSAIQTVFHDSKYPSHVVLPVIPAKNR